MPWLRHLLSVLLPTVAAFLSLSPIKDGLQRCGEGCVTSTGMEIDTRKLRTFQFVEALLVDVMGAMYRYGNDASKLKHFSMR